MQKQTFEVEVGGRKLIAEFSDLADQASGSVTLRYGDTVILATAVMGHERKESMGYFPLTVDYEEKHYAAGAILGSRFMRREGRPTDEAVLSGRVVDRTIRPLFDQRIRNEVQVIITVLSLGEFDPDVLAVNAASLALATSDVPWSGPVSAVRIGKLKNGDMVINPSYLERSHDEYHYDVLACGKDALITMIEVGAEEASEAELSAALEKAVEEHTAFNDFQKKIIAEIGKQKREVAVTEITEDVAKLFSTHITPKLNAAVICGEPGKAALYELKALWKDIVKEHLPETNTSDAGDYYEEKVDEEIHRAANEDGKRPDKRAFDEVRPLYAQAGDFAPNVHGTGIFYRGGTHVFTALTLGGPGDSQLIDSIEEQDEKKHFMHHYNFPPYAPGEVGRMGGFNRRMIGHGALAEKSLAAVIPPQAEFPYTIRLVSECMASNGSTSMASVCASTLALMDGGVPIIRPVAGIAIGLMHWKDGYKILTDIQGPEDSHGDMDFKVAGTSVGVTGVQMDVKVDGVSMAILREAFEAAKKARLHILETIVAAIPEPRKDISPRAPKIIVMQIKQDQIGLVIGPGGKTINGIRDETKVDDITIEENGLVFITGRDGSAELAQKAIAELTHEYVAGEEFQGEVTRILDFGAFVKIGKNTEGLVHISEIAPFRIEKVDAVLAVGEKVPVVIKEIDEKERVNLSIKRVDPDFAARKGISAPTNSGHMPTGQ